MNIKLKESPEQKALFAAIGSKNREESFAAQEAFAAFITPVVQTVLYQASTVGAVYVTKTFNEDDSPSIPLDLYFDEGTEFVQVWSQDIAGGLGTSHVEGMKEMKISTYNLQSAVSFNKAYARKARLNVLEKAIQRMINEVIVKQERNAYVPMLLQAANGNINGVQNTFRSNTADIFGIDDLNKMITRMKRINQSFANGTPSNYQSKGLTNILCSPEILEQCRAMSYQPMNTYNGSTTTSGATSIALPDTIRTEIFNSAGTKTLFNIQIADVNELGINAKMNTLFDTLAGSTSYSKANGSGGAVFAATDEIVLGFDLSRDNLIRAVMVDQNGSETNVLPDNQFVDRQGKVGFWLSLDEGRVAVDARAQVGLIV